MPYKTTPTMKRKVIVIDVKTRTLRYETVETRFDVYKLLGPECHLFECPIEFDNRDSIYTDEEALFNPIEGGFIMPDWSYAITGNGVIQGTDEDGEAVDVKTTIEELTPLITWTTKEAQELWRDQIL